MPCNGIFEIIRDLSVTHAGGGAEDSEGGGSQVLHKFRRGGAQILRGFSGGGRQGARAVAGVAEVAGVGYHALGAVRRGGLRFRTRRNRKSSGPPSACVTDRSLNNIYIFAHIFTENAFILIIIF